MIRSSFIHSIHLHFPQRFTSMMLPPGRAASSAGLNFPLTLMALKQTGFYPSKDGTKIPMFIVYKKGVQLNGSNPTLLYAYGGFNISSLPGFSATLIPWLEARRHLCIGQPSWWCRIWERNGMKQVCVSKSQNVFDDFIAQLNISSILNIHPEKDLSIRGGSNGGLLVGAVTNPASGPV